MDIKKALQTSAQVIKHAFKLVNFHFETSPESFHINDDAISD